MCLEIQVELPVPLDHSLVRRCEEDVSRQNSQRSSLHRTSAAVCAGFRRRHNLNDSTLTVHVNLDQRSYDIAIGTDNLSDIGQRYSSQWPLTHAVVITDTNVQSLADVVTSSLQQAGVRTTLCLVPAGEPSKSISEASRLWDELLSQGTDRKSVVFAVGGGVIGDLAGFIAATFTRGLNFCQVPTTLLAQVDSSVGGKVGINLTGAKNMVGAFWQPQYVLIDTEVLQTLPDREYRSGLAEVVKYGVILDADFFAYLESNVERLKERDADVLREVIARCCRLKADVVEADERETSGLRAVLNYGHTFAHAFEAVLGYGELLHGEAVSIGMICASRLAESLGRIEPSVTQRQQELLVGLQLPIQVPDSENELLIDAMKSDKKTEHGRLRFVLPDRLGHVELVSGVETSEVINTLNACR